MGWAHPSECLGAVGPDWASHRKQAEIMRASLRLCSTLSFHVDYQFTAYSNKNLLLAHDHGSCDRLCTARRNNILNCFPCEGRGRTFCFAHFFVFQFKCFLIHSPLQHASRNRKATTSRALKPEDTCTSQIPVDCASQTVSEHRLCRYIASLDLLASSSEETFT